MMKSMNTTQEDVKPAPGWACISLGVGFLVVLTGSVILIRLIA